MWPIYHYPTVSLSYQIINLFNLTDLFILFKSVDKLVILPDGKLRHFIKNLDDEDDFHQKDNEQSTPYFYDHEQGQYCMEKVKFFFWIRINYKSKSDY